MDGLFNLLVYLYLFKQKYIGIKIYIVHIITMKKNVLILIIFFIIILLSFNKSIYISNDLEDKYMSIELIKTSRSKSIVVKKGSNVVFIPFYGVYEEFIENYVLSKYRSYKVIYIENDSTDYKIEDVFIKNNQYIEINDIFCIYFYKNPTDIPNCKVIYIDDNIINFDIELNYNVELIIYESKKFSPYTLEQIYYNWIDTYMINKNSSIEIIIDKNLEYELKVNSL